NVALLPPCPGCGAPPCSAPVAVASTSPSTLAISYPATPSVVTISMAPTVNHGADESGRVAGSPLRRRRRPAFFMEGAAQKLLEPWVNVRAAAAVTALPAARPGGRSRPVSRPVSGRRAGAALSRGTP